MCWAGPLHAEKNSVERVAALLQSGGRAAVTALDRDGLTPLHRAAAGNAVDVALLLLAAGAPVDATDAANGETPLHVAADNDSAAVAMHLVRAGANVNAANTWGKTPRDVAEDRGFLTFASFLQVGVGVAAWAAAHGSLAPALCSR